jgi:CheY-like chemotaxis protein
LHYLIARIERMLPGIDEPQPSVPMDLPMLFVGDRARPEFAPIAEWLASRDAQFAESISAALARIKTTFTPTIIVVAQPWPGRVSAAQIESLRQAAPLARIVSLLGTWLEGEARTGKPWPAVWRTYWHGWLPRFEEELKRLAAGEESVWSLPSTATDEERLLQAVSPADPKQSSALPAKSIAIISTNRETAETLGDICRNHGWKPCWLKSVSETLPKHIDLAIFDSRNLHEDEVSKISNLKSEIPWIVLAGFPRIADVEQLKAIGVAAVVSKPFFNHELARQIDKLLAKPAHAA